MSSTENFVLSDDSITSIINRFHRSAYTHFERSKRQLQIAGRRRGYRRLKAKTHIDGKLREKNFFVKAGRRLKNKVIEKSFSKHVGKGRKIRRNSNTMAPLEEDCNYMGDESAISSVALSVDNSGGVTA
jgi:hypothetical protein